VRHAALALLLGAACQFGPQPRPPSNEGDWAAARDAATRSGKLYDGLTTNAFVRTVYQSRGVREARVARVAAWKVLTAAEAEKLLATERDEADRYDDFLVFLFTPDRLDNDLDTLRSVWRVALVVDGQPDRLPEGGREVRVDAMLRELYPAIGDFDTVYRLRFRREPAVAGRQAVLRMAGAKGRLDFPYELR
jgi:hypothetical protein